MTGLGEKIPTKKVILKSHDLEMNINVADFDPAIHEEVEAPRKKIEKKVEEPKAVTKAVKKADKDDDDD